MTADAMTVVRCFGTGQPDYEQYHDHEWGVPVREESAVFERMVLEGFQSGLSWLTILRKRDNFREAFAQFEPAAVAAFTDADRERLMANAGIVRNGAKIDAAIANARAAVALHETGGSLSDLVWQHAPAQHRPPATLEDMPAKTAESIALATALKRRGFVWVGPTTMYALMQACGVVNDHLATCVVRSASPE